MDIGRSDVTNDKSRSRHVCKRKAIQEPKQDAILESLE